MNRKYNLETDGSSLYLGVAIQNNTHTYLVWECIYILCHSVLSRVHVLTSFSMWKRSCKINSLPTIKSYFSTSNVCWQCRPHLPNSLQAFPMISSHTLKINRLKTKQKENLENSPGVLVKQYDHFILKQLDCLRAFNTAAIQCPPIWLTTTIVITKLLFQIL